MAIIRRMYRSERDLRSYEVTQAVTNKAQNRFWPPRYRCNDWRPWNRSSMSSIYIRYMKRIFFSGLFIFFFIFFFNFFTSQLRGSLSLFFIWFITQSSPSPNHTQITTKSPKRHKKDTQVGKWTLLLHFSTYSGHNFPYILLMFAM